MVSSFLNPGFPPVHAHLTLLPTMDASLSATIDSFDASMRSMRAAFREAIAAMNFLCYAVIWLSQLGEFLI
ncbi:hypothetical protein ACFX13_036431 [Malus domestica]